MTATWGGGDWAFLPWGGTAPAEPGPVIGIDVTYLRASHDPSIILVAYRGTALVASHTPSFDYTIRRRDRLSNRAGQRITPGQRAGHRPYTSKRGSA